MSPDAQGVPNQRSTGPNAINEMAHVRSPVAAASSVIVRLGRLRGVTSPTLDASGKRAQSGYLRLAS